MIFTLHVLKDNKPLTWYYDTYLNVVYDENRVEFYNDIPRPRFWLTKPFTRECNPNIKEKKNSLLEISLGNNCNFKCKYCSQLNVRGKSYSASPSDVPHFIDLLEKSGLQCSRIQLWGGEPLVYWKTIVKLVPELRRLYPNAHLSAPSNGYLLTRDKVDFYNKYNMYLFISHDGCGNDKRTKDTLTNPVSLDAIRYALRVMPKDHISFGVTPTSGNLDLNKITKYISDKVGEDVFVSTHNIVRCHDSTSEDGVKYSKLSESELKEYSNNVYNMLASNDGHDYSLHKKLDEFCFRLLEKEPITQVRAECSLPFSDGIIVNLKGDILQCHNHVTKDKVFGHLSDLSAIKPLGYNYALNKKRCRECLVIHGCKGGCPSADDKANELACPNLYALWFGIFRAAISRLFGAYLVSVEKTNFCDDF